MRPPLRHTLAELVEVTSATAAAAIQATRAIHVWLIKYKNYQLDAAIDALLNGQHLPIPAAEGSPEGHTFADLLDAMTEGHPELRESLEAGGRHIFQSYVNPHLKREYNAMKHGNRVSIGSFQAQTDRVDINWDRSVVFQSLKSVEAEGQRGFVLEWGVHQINLKCLHSQTKLCLQWLEALHWTLRRLMGIQVQEQHPGYPLLEEVEQAWSEGSAVLILAQELGAGRHVLDDGYRSRSLLWTDDMPLPNGFTKREK